MDSPILDNQVIGNFYLRTSENRKTRYGKSHTKHGRPIMPAGVNSFLKNIVNAYNKKESKLAEEEKREPELMPPISSHTLRHTGCTRLGENNINPKVMQYVMGHSDAQITMNVYNHIADKSHVENEMSKMNLPETVPAVV